MAKTCIYLFCISLLIQSCMIANQAFVPTGYDPSMLQKKRDSRMNFSTGPHLMKINYSIAINNKAGINFSTAYFRNGEFADAGYVQYFSKEKYNVDISGGLYYLYNNTEFESKGNLSILSTAWRDRRFNISFYSPYVAGSFISKDNKNGVGLNTKVSYNFIGFYDFYERTDSYQGSGHYPTPIDLERLVGKVPPFISVESAINVYFNLKSLSSLKIQIGYAWRFPTYLHKNSFLQKNGPVPNYIVTKTYTHPTMFPLYFNIGWSRKLGFNKTERE